MTKERRSFFVDDILHMVMPINKNTSCPNENNNLKRKRSIDSDDGNRNKEETISNKKFRSQHHGKNDHNDEEKDDNDESNYSQAIDIIRHSGVNEEESCTSDNSNNSGTYI
jgi:hypothetical protein